MRAILLALGFGLTGLSVPALADVDKDLQPKSITSFSGAYLAAATADADRDLNAAEAFYRRALEFNADDQWVQQQLMLTLIAKGDIDEALDYAEKLKDVADIEKFSRLTLAVDAINSRHFQKAQTYLKLALENDLDRLITSLMTAWTKYGADDVDGALEHLEKMDGPAWYTIFRILHTALLADAVSRPEIAEENFKKLLDSPANRSAVPELYLETAKAYAIFLARQNNKQKALETLAIAEEMSPNRRELKDLRQKIENGAALKPIAATAREGAAQVLFGVSMAINRPGAEDFVTRYLQLAKALHPDNALIVTQLALLAERLGQTEQAIEHYNAIGDESPWRHHANLRTGLNLAELKRTDEAIQSLRKVIEAEPKQISTYLALNRVYAIEERFAESEALMEEAISSLKETDIKKEHWPLFYRRGIAKERQERWMDAEPDFLKALELHPDQPQVMNYLGYTWIDQEVNLDKGLELIKKAAELRPNAGYIIDSLGWVYYRLGRYEEAVEQLEHALQLTPGDPVINDHLGDAYWRVGRKLEATFQWRHALAREPEPDDEKKIQQKLKQGLSEEATDLVKDNSETSD